MEGAFIVDPSCHSHFYYGSLSLIPLFTIHKDNLEYVVEYTRGLSQPLITELPFVAAK